MILLVVQLVVLLVVVVTVATELRSLSVNCITGPSVRTMMTSPRLKTLTLALSDVLSGKNVDFSLSTSITAILRTVEIRNVRCMRIHVNVT